MNTYDNETNANETAANTPRPAARKFGFWKFSAILVLALTLLCTICAAYLSHRGMVVIDGSPIDGLAGMSIGIIAIVFGMLAALIGIAIAVVVTVGTGIFMILVALAIAAAILLAVMAAIAPVLLPMIGLAALIIWAVRKNKTA